MLGWKPFCIHVRVVKGPLDFNFILQWDSIYAMNVVVSTLFRVMYFPHNGSIITIDHLLFINSNSCINLKHLTFLSVPNVRVDSFIIILFVLCPSSLLGDSFNGIIGAYLLFLLLVC